jgi:hypothetical protein
MFAKSLKNLFFLSFKVITAFAVWFVTPYILTKAHRHFKGSHCHHRRGKGTKDATASPNPPILDEFVPDYTASKSEKLKHLKLSLHTILHACEV